MEFFPFSVTFLYTNGIRRKLRTNNAIIRGPQAFFLVHNYQNLLLSLTRLVDFNHNNNVFRIMVLRKNTAWECSRNVCY